MPQPDCINIAITDENNEAPNDMQSGSFIVSVYLFPNPHEHGLFFSASDWLRRMIN